MYITCADGTVTEVGAGRSALIDILSSDLRVGAEIKCFSTHMEVKFPDGNVRLVCGDRNEITKLKDNVRTIMMLK